MDVAVSLACPCRPGFAYKNVKFLAAHKKSKLHQSWEAVQEVKDVRVQSKQFENEIERLKRRLTHKEAVEVELLNRIHQLEGELAFLKKAYAGVYVN